MGCTVCRLLVYTHAHKPNAPPLCKSSVLSDVVCSALSGRATDLHMARVAGGDADAFAKLLQSACGGKLKRSSQSAPAEWASIASSSYANATAIEVRMSELVLAVPWCSSI